ncbi:MAG: tetratricopeptide repeat protein [Deltaproteobacteria bacterium]|nr:tetratricopeptide repeat protein [Deltaproteobacteria bacterium]
MIRRLTYTVLTVGLVGLCGLFALRLLGEGTSSLPAASAPEGIRGSCEDGLGQARELTKNGGAERSYQAYLWLIGQCADSPVLPDILLEAGSLFGHLLEQPGQARRVYEEFLLRFPTHPQADDAIFHLARLEIDAGDYTQAVSHLTTLAQHYPGSEHQESAKFLATKAAEMLAADRRRLHTLPGQLAALIPNNLLSLLAVVAALGPSIIQAASKAQANGGEGQKRRRWMMPVVIIVLTLLNYAINNIESRQRNAALMEKLDRLVTGVKSHDQR